MAILHVTENFSRGGVTAQRKLITVAVRVAPLRRRGRNLVTVQHDLWSLSVPSSFNTQRQPNKLRHGPREGRCRSRSRAETKTRDRALLSIPNLLGNHQPIVC